MDHRGDRTDRTGMDFDGVIFDMDGVLVNSEPVITKAAIACLAEYGVTACHHDFLPFTGTGEDRFIGGVAELHGLTYRVEMKHRTYEIYLTLVDGEIGLYPGIRQLLEDLSLWGYKVALGSSADLVKVRANLRAADLPESLFGALVCGSDVAKKKPAPDLFLEAARRINLDPARALVVEDALSGLTAAGAAGMASVGIATSFTPEELLAGGAREVFTETRQLGPWLRGAR